MNKHMNNYKFINEKGEHLHTLNDKPLMGTSTVLSVLSKPLTYWAAGLAVAELGWTPINGDDKKPVPLEKRLPFAEARLEYVKGLSAQDYLKLLDKAYKAHATNLKSSAKSGTDLHLELSNYIIACIKDNNGVPLKV